MAQPEVYNFLKSNPNKFFSSKSIGEKLGLPQQVVTKDVTQLSKYNFIDLNLKKSNTHKPKFMAGFFSKK